MLVGNRFRMGDRIGGGSFGEVFRCTEGGQTYAMKLEPRDSKPCLLKYEYMLYRHLGHNALGFPNVHWYGVEAHHNVLVLALLGPSIDTLFKKCGGKFKIRTVLLLAGQLLDRVEHMHMKGFLHRDLKPDNFAIGGTPETAHIVHLFDLGLAKKITKLRPMLDKRSLTGTARFAARAAHNGLQQCRRDDLESLGYVLVYLALGVLPWQGIHREDKMQKLALVKERKFATSIESLTKGLPSAFAKYFNYLRMLKHDSRPDYAFLRALFSNYDLEDRKFEWETQETPKLPENVIIDVPLPLPLPLPLEKIVPPVPLPLQKVVPPLPPKIPFYHQSQTTRLPIPQIQARKTSPLQKPPSAPKPIIILPPPPRRKKGQ